MRSGGARGPPPGPLSRRPRLGASPSPVVRDPFAPGTLLTAPSPGSRSVHAGADSLGELGEPAGVRTLAWIDTRAPGRPGHGRPRGQDSREVIARSHTPCSRGAWGRGEGWPRAVVTGIPSTSLVAPCLRARPPSVPAAEQPSAGCVRAKGKVRRRIQRAEFPGEHAREEPRRLRLAVQVGEPGWAHSGVCYFMFPSGRGLHWNLGSLPTVACIYWARKDFDFAG